MNNYNQFKTPYILNSVQKARALILQAKREKKVTKKVHILMASMNECLNVLSARFKEQGGMQVKDFIPGLIVLYNDGSGNGQKKCVVYKSSEPYVYIQMYGDEQRAIAVKPESLVVECLQRIYL